MNLRSLTLAPIIIIALVFTGYRPSLQTNVENLAPYIYYYSAAKAGFVTERADGSDSHLLGKFEPPNNTMITGPGWSPSGKWLAWTIWDVEGGSLFQSVAYLVNRDGNQINLFPQDNVKGGIAHAEMLWSPTKDLLLVNYHYAVYDATGGDPSSSKHEFFVYDPNTQTRLYLPESGTYNEWAPNGNNIVSFSDESTNLTIQSLDVTSKPIIKSFHLANNCLDTGLPRWSADGKFAYITSDQKTIAVEDFEHNNSYLLPLPVGTVRFFDWSPDGQYALLYTSEQCDSLNAKLWLLDIPTQQVSQVTQYPQFQIPVRQRMESYSRFTQEYNFYSATAWNKDSSYALAVSIENVPYLIRSNPFEIAEIGGKQIQ